MAQGPTPTATQAPPAQSTPTTTVGQPVTLPAPLPKRESAPFNIDSRVEGYPVIPVDPKAFPKEHSILTEASQRGYQVEFYQASPPFRGFRITRTSLNPDGSPLSEPVSVVFLRSDGNPNYLAERNKALAEALDREMRHPPLQIVGLAGQVSPTSISFNCSPDAWQFFSAERERVAIRVLSSGSEGQTPHTVYQLVDPKTETPLGPPIHTSIYGNQGARDRDALLLAAARAAIDRSAAQHILTLQSEIPGFPCLMLSPDLIPRTAELRSVAEANGMKLSFLGHRDGRIIFQLSLQGKPPQTFGLSTQDYDSRHTRDRILSADLRRAMEQLEPKSIAGAVERKERLVEQLVVDHANTTAAFRESVRYGLILLPESLLRELSQGGFKVHAKWYPRQDDIGSASNPRGHDGKDLNTVAGVFRADSKSIIVAEKQLDSGSNKFYDGSAWEPTTLHEVGHAIDFARHLSRSPDPLTAVNGDRWQNGVSYSGPLLAAYRADWDRLPTGLKSKDSPVNYFLQPEYNSDFRAGQQEAFAEAFQIALGGPGAQSCEKFADRFPNVLRAVREFVETERKKDERN
ncbi:MAG: hypothetical protein U0136_01310 [Bdellovibrionota bacterium]